MGRRIGWAMIAGIFSAVVAWRLCLPYFFVEDLPDYRLKAIMACLTTDGQLYGIVLSGTFSFLFCALTTIIYSSHLGLIERLGRGLIAGLLGSLAFCLVWVACDHLCIMICQLGMQGVRLASLVKVTAWALMVSVLCLAVYVALELRKPRWVFLVITAYTVSGIMHAVQLVLMVILMFGMIFKTGEAIQATSRHPVDPQILNESTGRLSLFIVFISLAILGLLMGPLMALIEMQTRKAWLKLKTPGRSAKTWSVEEQVVRIGCSTKCEIRMDQAEDFAPLHAQIQRHGTEFSLVDLGTPGGTNLNGKLVQKAWLHPGDTIRTGFYSFEFCMRDPAPAAQSSGTTTPMSLAVIPELVTGVRLCDEFGNTYPLREGKTVIGSHSDCDICLAWEPSVEKHHAEIVIDQAEVTLHDLGTQCGTLLNTEQIDHEQPLTDGDQLILGTAKLTYRLTSNPHSPLDG